MFENKKKRKKILPLTSCVHRHKQATMFRLLVCVFFSVFLFPIFVFDFWERERDAGVCCSVGCMCCAVVQLSACNKPINGRVCAFQWAGKMKLENKKITSLGFGSLLFLLGPCAYILFGCSSFCWASQARRRWRRRHWRPRFFIFWILFCTVQVLLHPPWYVCCDPLRLNMHCWQQQPRSPPPLLSLLLFSTRMIMMIMRTERPLWPDRSGRTISLLVHDTWVDIFVLLYKWKKKLLIWKSLFFLFFLKIIIKWPDYLSTNCRWFTFYPAACITRAGFSVDSRCFTAFQRKSSRG